MSMPFDRLIVLDFETAWGRAAKLGFSCQTTEEYIRDPHFKAWGLSWKDIDLSNPQMWQPGQPIRTGAVWVRGSGIKAWAEDIDWSRTAVVCQNTQFDGAILSWVYGIRPAFLFDTLSMARALYGIEAGNSLKKLAERFELPPKGDGLASSENILDALPFVVEQELAEYCKHDSWLCEQILLRMLPGYPASELRLIDMTLRMFTLPELELDANMLTQALLEEKTNREALLARLNITDSVLASNDLFAEALRQLGVEPPTKKKKPTAKTPKPVGVNFAFAKTDAMFQAMLNGDNEDVALLCEARLKVKSTSERTRAQRFLDISNRGTLPVPLSYFGAKSGRWTAAKGSAINMQNLKRGSFLRKAIMAPKGKVLVVGDLSQIEPRVLAWLSDYDEMLAIFRAGGDPYAAFGAQMFNLPGMTKDSHPVQRQSAKSALLGCFGPDTPVLTKRGWVPIVQVQATDTVWDGEDWIWHQGVVPQGEKEVLTALGVSATSDHEILTERGWAAWSEVLANRSLLKSALSLASLPACAGSAGSTNEAAAPFTRTCGAPAVGRGSYTAPTSWLEELRGVIAALKEKLSRRVGSNKATLWCAPTVCTESVYSIASAPSLRGARTLKATSTPTTVGAVLPYIRNGLKTGLRSCSTWLRWMGGTSRSYSWIAQTIAGGMNPATCASSHAVSTCPTSDASAREKSKQSNNVSAYLKQRMQTYDIAYAGPRNRYTILTDEGPLVVHNCGYGLGWASFAAQLLVGFLGAPPLRYTKADAKQLGVTGVHVLRFLENKDYMEKMFEIAHICTDEELLIHCVTAKAIIDKYRATAQPVVGLWNLCSELIEHSLYNGNEYTHKCLTFRKEEIVLPNGMKIIYDGLRRGLDEDKRVQWTYGANRDKLYAGKIVNNITQGTARIVMTDGMLRVDKRYPCKGTVHDELLALAPEEGSQEALAWVLAQMTKEPKYMPGIPLAADGGVHRRYGLAKN